MEVTCNVGSDNYFDSCLFNLFVPADGKALCRYSLARFTGREDRGIARTATQTLTAGAEVFYQMSEYYHPESAGGVHLSDPLFGIEWPLAMTVIAERGA